MSYGRLVSKRLLSRNWRISWVLTIGIELALIFAVLGSGYFVYSLVRNTLIKQGINDVRFSAKTSASRLALEHKSHPTSAPVEDLAYLAISMSKYVLLTTNQGRFIAASGTKPPITPLNGWANVGQSGWVQFHGTPYVFASAPIRVGNVQWRLIFVESQHQVASLLYTLRIALALGSLVLIMSTLAAVSLIVRRVTDPLRELEELAKTVTLNVDGAIPTKVHSRLAEVHSLAESFDSMLERLGRAQLREREFISNAAHSLRTPIQVIQGNLQSLGQRLIEHPDLARQDLRALMRESQAMATLVDRLLQLSKAESGPPARLELIDLQLFLHHIAGDLRDSCMHHPLEMQVQDLAEPHVFTDPVLLEAVLRVLVENADSYAQEMSTVVVFAATNTNPRTTRIGVQNEGKPIPPEAIGQLFERFYRNRQAASSDHYGLGLAIADSIVKRIRAQWSITSDTNWTVFAVDLPSAGHPA